MNTSNPNISKSSSWTTKTVLLITFPIQLILILLVFRPLSHYDYPSNLLLSDPEGITPRIWLYMLALAVGIGIACWQKHWLSIVVQLAPPILLVAYFYRPIAHYEAAEYQHLVGRNISEVRKELDTRLSVSGYSSTNGKSIGRLSVHGMEIISTKNEGRIIEVRPNQR